MKSQRHNVSPDVAQYMSILTAPHGLIVESSLDKFTDRILAVLEAKYPAISRGILEDCVKKTQIECARVALLEGTKKLAEYEVHDAPVTALGPVQDTRDRIVKAILEAE